MRDLYVSRASEVTGVDRSILQNELSVDRTRPIVPQRQPLAPRISTEVRARRPERRTRPQVRNASAEKELIRAMLAQRARVETIAERVGPDSFRDPRYRAIFTALLASGDATMDEIAPMLDAEQIEVVESLLEESTAIEESDAIVDVQRTIDDSLAKLEVRDMEDRLAELDRLIPLASNSEKDTLDEERKQLVHQMRASGKMSFKAFRRGRAR
jgi:hypothetical protein